ncbi:MAG: hypothetical protein ACE5PM_06300 [Candidatus Hydrothermarchaeales archaeon]
MRKRYLISVLLLALLVTLPLALGSIKDIISVPSTENVVDVAVLIPEVGLKVAMLDYDPVAKSATFAIVENRSVIDYKPKTNMEVGQDLELIENCDTYLIELKQDYVTIAFACKGRPYIVLVANSIDYALATDFVRYFTDQDVTVIHVTAEEFNDYRNDYKYALDIVILGGPDAYEGVGDITRELLNETEEEFLRIEGNRGMFVKKHRWLIGQTITVLAGFDRYQTQMAHIENRHKFVVS